MSKTQFKLDTKAVRTEILQADWMLSYIEGEANKIADADSEVVSFIGFDRAKAIIYPNRESRK